MSDSKVKPSILPLVNQINEKIRVSLSGGRTVVGVLKGYDELVNIVLDNAVEEEGCTIRESSDPSKPYKPRKLGLIVIRGTQVVLINPCEGEEVIDNPFVGDDDEQEEEEGEGEEEK